MGGKASPYITRHSDQLNRAISPWTDIMSKKSWGVNMHIMQCSSPTSVIRESQRVCWCLAGGLQNGDQHPISHVGQGGSSSDSDVRQGRYNITDM